MNDGDVTLPADAEEALPPASTRLGRLSRELLHRYPLWPVIAFLAKKRVPVHAHSSWYMLGGIALFFFAVQLLTGILLMVYYRPAQPWASVNRIVMEVPFGALIRSVHHWSANLMVFAVFVHMFSTLFLKAYRRPREGTWMTGAALLALVLAFGFSGYLLPWDELAFFATRVGITEQEKLPVLGPILADLMRGGPDVTIDTIGRFYVLHVVVLPLLILGLISIHLLFIQVQGVSEPDSFAALPEKRKRYRPFFSDFLIGEAPVWMFLGVLLVALAAAAPREVAPEADVFAPAPAGIKPEWYLLAPYQLLKLFPGSLELIGMAILTLAPALLLVLPFVDTERPSGRRGRLITRLAIGGVLGFVVISLWGFLS